MPTKKKSAPSSATAQKPPAQPEAAEAWFVVHTYSGQEDKVKRTILSQARTNDLQDKVLDVVVPTEPQVELKEGKRQTVVRKIFPGYILVRMKLDQESWNLVRRTTGVTGFVGPEGAPSPLSEDEVKQLLNQMQAETPRVKTSLSKGSSIRIVEGPFAELMGIVDEVNPEKGKVKALVSIFGRETPIELDILQVEKI